MIYHGEEGTLDEFEQTVDMTIKALALSSKHYDSIIVRGVSGLLVGAPVALAMGKPLLVVRKPGESSHDSHKVINVNRAGEHVLFLDDFRSSGATEQECAAALYSESTFPSIVHCYFYRLTWGVTPHPEGFRAPISHKPEPYMDRMMTSDTISQAGYFSGLFEQQQRLALTIPLPDYTTASTS